jgi:ATP-dependent RNA helicase DDX19/DBP5
MDCKNSQHKVDVLCAIYGLLTIGQSMIFVRVSYLIQERRTAESLAQIMQEQGHEVTCLHGKFEGGTRDAAIDDFRLGKTKVLISTNVIARGIDILQVNLVINYDIPLIHQTGEPDVETYIHRIGRTGRFGRQGVSINFVHDEQSYSEMKAIEKAIGKEIARVPTENYMDIEKILKKAVK